MFINFSDIQVEDKTTWAGKKIISFDIDWAADEVLNYALDLIEPYEIPVTFFVTHDTPVLERIRANQKWELAIHPNFNPLIDKDATALSAEETITKMKEIVPEAKVLRSHSLTHSGRWLSLYAKQGMSITSNTMMNRVSYAEPFYQVNGLLEVPIYFADDGWVFINDKQTTANHTIDEIVEKEHTGIRVFNFHPIHIALNSESFARYNAVREQLNNWEAIQEGKFDGEGSEFILKKLIEENK